MKEADMIWVASKALAKNIDYESLMYSDDLYGTEDFIDEVWDYVLEGKEECYLLQPPIILK